MCKIEVNHKENTDIFLFDKNHPKKITPLWCLHPKITHGSQRILHLDSLFLVERSWILRFEFQTEECTHKINSILCIKDVRTDVGTIAEEKTIKPKQRICGISSFFFLLKRAMRVLYI